jgi:glycosyltransferase involved in cell wall biosynthesis
MPAPVIVLTPNLAGRDGISRLARLVTGTFEDATVVALHDSSETTTFGRAQVRGADGRYSRFVTATVRAAASGDSRVTVIAVHLHLAPAALAFCARGASLVTLLCGVEAWKPLTWIQRAALDRAEHLIAISQFTRERFLEANPHFKGRAIDVCHPGVDAAPAATSDAGAPPSALIVGRMAGDERYKGHDALLEIWPEVAAAVPDAVLRIVGDGDDRPRLERKAAALALGPQILFLGRLDDAALGREYASCGAFVMPSRHEGFGFVFVEAMRAGRPCIGALGAAGEIIVDGETGWLVPAGDRAQLRDRVVWTLRDRVAADAMGGRGRRRFLQHFTEARFRDRFTALLRHAEPALTA